MEENAIMRSLAVLLFTGCCWSGHIKEDKMCGTVAHIGEMRSAYIIFVGNPRRKG
jgi:hypothetical protein